MRRDGMTLEEFGSMPKTTAEVYVWLQETFTRELSARYPDGADRVARRAIWHGLLVLGLNAGLMYLVGEERRPDVAESWRIYDESLEIIESACEQDQIPVPTPETISDVSKKRLALAAQRLSNRFRVLRGTVDALAMVALTLLGVVQQQRQKIKRLSPGDVEQVKMTLKQIIDAIDFDHRSAAEQAASKN